MNDELSAMHDRALQAEQALIEARNYHKDEVARLEERLRHHEAAPTMEDNFRGSDRDLIECAQSLLNFDAAGKLVPHGIGGLARGIIEAFVSRFPRSKPSSHPVKKTVPASSKSPKWYPTPDKLWLAYGPDMGLEFYATEQEAIDAGANFIEDHIGDDGWDEAVEQVFVGKAIHITRQTNVVKRPPDEELDEDGFDEEGNDWSGDHDCRCNYELEAVAAAAAEGS